MTLGVAGAEVQLIASDENFAADLANADRPRPARAHSQLGLILVSVGRQNRLRAFIGPAERAFGPVAFELRDHPVSQDSVHVRLVILSRGQRYGDIFDCRPRAAYAEYPRCKAQPHRPPWRWIFAPLTRAAEKAYVRHKAITWRRAAEGQPTQQTSAGGSEPGADRLARRRSCEVERPNRAFPSRSRR